MLFLKTIILTGGGTAGHVTPNLALIPHLQQEGYRVLYIGTQDGMEKGLIEKTGIPYYSVSTGKLRRYMSKENFTDAFKVVKGIAQAKALIKKLKPDIVFSKGGFVAVPVIIGAKLNGVPVIAHESDLTPGLANKIAMPFAKVVCTTFPETVKYIPDGKGINTGSPIRDELFKGDRQKGLEICGFNNEKPVLMMMGGSLGSQKINKVLREDIDRILEKYQFVHICGKGNIADIQKTGYRQFEYLSEELTHVLAAADCVISRAGSNSISEFLALKKPMLLIPLSANASRGDQILNAESFEKQGFAIVLKEEEMNDESLFKNIDELFLKKETLKAAMDKSHMTNGVENVCEIIRKYS